MTDRERRFVANQLAQAADELGGLLSQDHVSKDCLIEAYAEARSWLTQLEALPRGFWQPRPKEQSTAREVLARAVSRLGT